MKRDASRSEEQQIPVNDPVPEAPAIMPAPGKSLLRAFTSLRHRNFRLYWFGQMVSLTGTYMQIIGQSWLVLQLTHSGWQLGLVGALQFLPVLLFSVLGGVFADRWPKRLVALFTQVAAMIQAFVLWVLIATGTVQLWHIYVLSILLGFTYCLDRPVRRAFVVEMVGREDLPNAVALNSSLTTLTRIVGPSLGGIIIAASGISMLFLLNALSFPAVIVALALIRTSELHNQPQKQPDSGERQSTWQSLHEGVSYVLKTRAVLLIILVVGLVLLFGANFSVLLPLFATQVLQVGATGFGFLSAAIGFGALLAALWLAWSNRQPTIHAILIAALIFGLLEVAFAVSHIYLLSLALIAITAFIETTFAEQSIILIQTVTPDRLQGRVMSVVILFFDGSIPPGYLLTGWLANLFGPSIALLIGAGLTMTVAAVGWLYRKPAISN